MIDEIEGFAPENVIFTTEAFGRDEILYEAFGQGWTQSSNNPASGHVEVGAYKNAKLFWVRYPGRNSNEQIERQIATIARHVSGA